MSKGKGTEMTGKKKENKETGGGLPGKVAFAEPPRQHVDFLVQPSRYFRADEIGGGRAGAPSQHSPAVVVTAVLGGGAFAPLARQRSHAVSGAGLVNVESLRAAAYVPPTEVPPLRLVPDLVVVKDIAGILAGTRRQSDEKSCWTGRRKILLGESRSVEYINTRWERFFTRRD